AVGRLDPGHRVDGLADELLDRRPRRLEQLAEAAGRPGAAVAAALVPTAALVLAVPPVAGVLARRRLDGHLVAVPLGRRRRGLAGLVVVLAHRFALLVLASCALVPGFRRLRLPVAARGALVAVAAGPRVVLPHPPEQLLTG